MRTIILTRTDMAPLEFTGRQIEKVTTARQGKERWSDIIVYKASNGQYIVLVSGRSIRPGENDLNEVHIVDQLDEIHDHLHYSQLSAELYEKLGIVRTQKLI